MKLHHSAVLPLVLHPCDMKAAQVVDTGFRRLSRCCVCGTVCTCWAVLWAAVQA